MSMGKILCKDRTVAKVLWVEKNWSARCLMKKFLSKGWSKSCHDRLIRKIDAGLPVDRIIGRGRRRSERTAAIHQSPCNIELQTGISRSSILQTAKLDLNLKTFKRMAGQKLNHTVRNTIAYPRRQNVVFIEPVDYAIWGLCRSESTTAGSSTPLISWSRQ